MEEKKGMAVVRSWLPGPNPLANSPDKEGKLAGFGRGLLHGTIAPILFIISLFNEDVHLYEVHNCGRWYNLGYLLGLMISLGGGRHETSRRQHASPTQQDQD